MEDQDTGATTSTTEQSAPATTSSEGTPANTPAAKPDASVLGQPADKNAAPQWSPNFKFKVYGEEKEVPESFRALIKDAKTEAEVRSVFEKATAVDKLKTLHQRVSQEHQTASGKVKQYESEFAKVRDGLTRVSNYAQNDLDSFFEAYKIPAEKVMQWVSVKLHEQELPEAQRQQIMQGRQAQREAENLRYQQTNLQTQSNEMFQNHHNMMMDMVRSQPEVSTFEKDFDLRFGDGEFQRHVNDYGDRMYRQGKYVPPHQAVAQVRAYYQRALSNNPAPAYAPGSAHGQGSPGAEPPQPIPNVGSGKSGVSPVKPKFKSLDQMKAYVKENYSEA